MTATPTAASEERHDSIYGAVDIASYILVTLRAARRRWSGR